MSLPLSVWSVDNPNPQSSRHYYVGQSGKADFQVHYSAAAANTSWVGVVMSETYAATNQTFQQWWCGLLPLAAPPPAAPEAVR